MTRLATLLVVALAVAGCSSEPSTEAQDALSLIQNWLGGRYDNREQVAREERESVPFDARHRLMFQVIQKLDWDGLPGLVYYQQSTADGSDDPEQLIRSGLLQFTAELDEQTVRYREYTFFDPARYVNAHLDPAALPALTQEELRWDEGCDFFLRRKAGGQEVSGPMPAGTCSMEAPGLGQTIYADDHLWLRADEIAFMGRFVDGEGRVVWGNATDEPVVLRKHAE